MSYRYVLLYRPPSSWTLPAGWNLVERPRLACGFDRRTDLPLSTHTFGVVEYSRPLADDEVRAYQLRLI